eukprot:6179507-Pleurochrysis_carterae.AAC.1
MSSLLIRNRSGAICNCSAVFVRRQFLSSSHRCRVGTAGTTYLSPRMRVSRPVVELNGVKDDSAMFVFVREELEEVAEAIAESPAVREQ